MVQVPGIALQIDTAAFREAPERVPSLRPMLNRYALAHFEQVARSAARNGRHDRLGNDFPMTHDFMSMMLGVRRLGSRWRLGCCRWQA